MSKYHTQLEELENILASCADFDFGSFPKKIRFLGLKISLK